MQEQRHEGTALPIRRILHAGRNRVPYIKIGFQAVGSIPAMMCSAMTDSGATKSLITEGHLQLQGFNTPARLAKIILPKAHLPLFEMAGGQLQRAACAVRLPLRLTDQEAGTTTDEHTFYVLNKKSPEVILGSDYLDPREAIVSYKDKHIC